MYSGNIETPPQQFCFLKLNVIHLYYLGKGVHLPKDIAGMSLEHNVLWIDIKGDSWFIKTPMSRASVTTLHSH